ncbi:hypothetical protein [Rikenella microfusus]|uniref:hypothetical protein n=1 Tax=Rikenella microfusus TaxID=28139 RepID=UPI001DB5BE08|nr:hypothetical protein [Rikenella microfusus]HJE88484.1 hypothetical protein [Rikenella microfusus]
MIHMDTARASNRRKPPHPEKNLCNPKKGNTFVSGKTALVFPLYFMGKALSAGAAPL